MWKKAFKNSLFNSTFLCRIVVAFLLPFFALSILIKFAATNMDLAYNDSTIEPRVGFLEDYKNIELVSHLKANCSIRFEADEAKLKQLLNDDTLDVYLLINDFQYTSDSTLKISLTQYSNENRNGKALRIVQEALLTYESMLIERNLSVLTLDPSWLDPIQVQKENTFSLMEEIGKMVQILKSSATKFLNILFFLFIPWLIRALILRLKKNNLAPDYKWLLAAMLACILTTQVLYWSVYIALGQETEGMLSSVLSSLMFFISFDALMYLFLNWISTCLFLISVLLLLYWKTKDSLQYVQYSFWVILLIQASIFAMLGTPSSDHFWLNLLPINNNFTVGYFSTLKGDEVGLFYCSSLVNFFISGILLRFVMKKIHQ